MKYAAQPSGRVGGLKHESAGWNRSPVRPASAARWVNPSSESAADDPIRVRTEAATHSATGVR